MRRLGTGRQSGIGSVGIEFETTRARMLQLREHRGELAVAGAARVELSEDAFIDDPRSRSAVSEQLRAAVVSGGFLGRQCVISLPRDEVHVHGVRLPLMPTDELREAAAWEAANRLDLARESIECDVLCMGGQPDAKERQDVLVIAAASASLESRLDAVLESGLRPVAVDTHFGGIARVLSRRQRRDSDADVRAVVEVGDAGSTVLVLRGGEVAFCKLLPIGGRHLDAHIAERLDLDIDAVGDLRLAMLDAAGPSVDTATVGAVCDAARVVLAELSRDVMLCLRHFAVGARGARPERLLLTGVHARESGLAECLETTCRLPVLLDDESQCTRAMEAGLPRLLHGTAGPASGWAIAAGLSLRGLQFGGRRRAA